MTASPPSKGASVFLEVVQVITVVLLAAAAVVTLVPIPYLRGTPLESYNVPTLQAQVFTLDHNLSGNLSQVAALQEATAEDVSKIASANSEIASLQTQISSDRSSISDLQNQLQGNASEIQTLEAKVQSLQAEVQNRQGQITSDQASLESLITELMAISDLQVSETWLPGLSVSQPAGGYTHWTETEVCPEGYITDCVVYPGYIVMAVRSNSSNTYAEVQWDAFNASYSQKIAVGKSGTAVFPVLPTSTVTVGVGNTNAYGGAAELVSVTYVY